MAFSSTAFRDLFWIQLPTRDCPLDCYHPALRRANLAKFLKELFSRFGVPRTILTDNAPFFKDVTTMDLQARFGFQHRRSIPHHQEGNAVAERAIQTLQEKLSLIMTEPSASVILDEHSPMAVLSINLAVCASTGFTPFELRLVAGNHSRQMWNFAMSS